MICEDVERFEKIIEAVPPRSISISSCLIEIKRAVLLGIGSTTMSSTTVSHVTSVVCGSHKTHGANDAKETLPRYVMTVYGMPGKEIVTKMFGTL